MPTKVAPETRKKIEEMLSRGILGIEISKQLGVHKATVVQVVKREWLARLPEKTRAVMQKRLDKSLLEVQRRNADKARTLAQQKFARDRADKEAEKAETSVIIEAEPSGKVGPLEAYRKALKKRLTVDKKADILVGLAESKSPQVAMRAIEHIDEIEGITSEVEGNKPTMPTGPIFLFPAGAAIDMRPVAQAQIIEVQQKEEEG